MYEMKMETQNDLLKAMTFCVKKNPDFSKKRDLRKIGRGSPILARKRFSTMQEVEKRLETIFNKE